MENEEKIEKKLEEKKINLPKKNLIHLKKNP